MAVSIVSHRRRRAYSAGRLARSAQRALSAMGRPGSQVEILVVSDEEMAELNARFLGVHAPTDVLAFPLEVPEAGEALLGQVIISADTARRQARRVGVPVALEMDLLATHGILHLAGYDDRDPVEAQLMHQRERAILGSARAVTSRLWSGLLP